MYMTVLKATFDSIRNGEYLMKFESGEFMHKWITSQFNCTRMDGQILYRIENTKETMYLYVQSKMPLPQKNIARAGMEVVRSYEIADLYPGCNIVFKMLYSSHVSKDGKRFFIKNPEDRIRKLCERLQLNAGLSGIKVKEIGIRTVAIKNDVKMECVEYIGIGTVTEYERFMNAVSNGFGHGKNYGMGLLLYKEI